MIFRLLKPISQKSNVKSLPAPKKKDSKKSLSRKTVTGKASIQHNSRNLNSSQIALSNSNSMTGTRGSSLKREYESCRKKIEFSGLSTSQKNKLLDKLYKLYEPILKYDSQYYSWAVSGPARYPAAKMEALANRKMDAHKKFYDWWDEIEPTLEKSTKSKTQLEKESNAKQIEKIKHIKDEFNRWYNRLLEELPTYKEKGRNPKYSSNAAMAQSYVSEALKVDTNLYKELFEKLNEVCNFSKNSNFYKGYKYVQEGKLSSDSIQKQEAENNKVIFSCPDYDIKNLKIQAGKRIAIKFTFYPKPQLVYALKKKGFTWYTFGDCFVCKPERFDLEWAKGIKEKYSKYL